VAQALAQRGDRARPHRGGVPLQVQADELGERQLGSSGRLAAQLGFVTSR
jgi:hypothetical protein